MQFIVDLGKFFYQHPGLAGAAVAFLWIILALAEAIHHDLPAFATAIVRGTKLLVIVLALGVSLILLGALAVDAVPS